MFTAGYVAKVGFDFKKTSCRLDGYKGVEDICDNKNIGLGGFYLKLGARYNF